MSFTYEMGWNEVIDPNFATVFKTKQDALHASNTYTTFGEYTKPVLKRNEVKKFSKFQKTGMIRRSMKPLTKYSKPYNGETPEEILNFWFNTANKDIRYEDYETWPELFCVFKHLFSVQSYHSDKNKDMITVDMKVNRNSKFEEFKYEFDLVKNRITYIDNRNDETLKIIGIMDTELSEYEAIYFVFDENRSIYRIENQRQSVKFSSNKLKDVFDYWRNVYWYQ